MALDTLQIKNMALDEVPEARIEAEDEASIPAETVASVYQPALELLLEDYDWDFAIRRQVLAMVANDRGNEWVYSYRLPGDMARPRFLLPFGGNEIAIAGSLPVYPVAGVYRGFEGRWPFIVGTDTVYTNREFAVFEYVANNPSPSTFTAKFARALAVEIASRIVMPLKKDRQRQGDLIKMAEVARERAKADAMNRDHESTRDFIPESQLVRSGVAPWQ
jgi:hypothetical protein